MQASNTDSKTVRYEDTAQIFYRQSPPPPKFPLGYYNWTLLNCNCSHNW